MKQYRWKRSDESDVFVNCPDHQDYRIYYARTKTAGKDWSYSPTNQLIHNLKKKPSCPANQLKYKQQAIEQFAEELSRLLSSESWKKRSFVLIPMPPSKIRSDSEFDNRIEQVAQKVVEKVSNASYAPLLESSSNRSAAHESGHSRTVDDVYKHIEFDEFCENEINDDSVLVILDDVATSGASFVAAHKVLQEQYPDLKIIGIFWAKAVPAPPDFDAVEPD